MARALKEKGFTKVRPLEGGLDAWVKAGHFAEDETIVAILRRGVRQG